MGKLILTVVGIRHNIEGGETMLPFFMKKLSYGTKFTLRLTPEGTDFPGAVMVQNYSLQTIGFISKDQIYKIANTIKESEYGEIDAVFTENCKKENKSFEVETDDLDIKPADQNVTNTHEADNEMVINFDEKDNFSAYFAKHLMRIISDFEKSHEGLDDLKLCLEKYLEICTLLADGESAKLRAEIVSRLDRLCKEYKKLKPLYDDLFNKYKDMTKSEVRIEVLEKQKKRISLLAEDKSKNDCSWLELYFNDFKCRCGGVISLEKIREERKTIYNMLNESLKGRYNFADKNMEAMASQVFSQNLSLRSIYVLFSRLLKYDYLGGLINKAKYGVFINDDDADLIEDLMPFFKEDLQKTLKFIKDFKNGIQITQGAEINVVAKLVIDGTLNERDAGAPLRKILANHHLYGRSPQNWNKLLSDKIVQLR